MNDRLIQRLASLLSLAAELFRIQQKSPHAPRSVASDLLHKKKKLLGVERRFVSEAAFLALRQKSFLAFCSGEQSTDADIIISALLTGALEGTFDADMNVNAIASARELDIPSRGDAEGLPDNAEGLPDNAEALLIAAHALVREDKTDFRETMLQRYHNFDANVHAALTEHDEADNELLELLAVRYSMPGWLVGKLSEVFSPPERLAGLLSSLNQPASVDLRVNTSVLNRRQVASLFHDSGIAVTELSLAPAALRMQEREDITELEVIRKGAVEIQDLGSQIIGLALNPGPDWRILDACAGAGGKSLHIADLQRNGGAIIAADVEHNRLRSLRQRSERCGLTSITTLQVNNDGSARRHGEEHLLDDETFDAVLVDAPCSGMGTVRRNPQIKWKLTEKGLGRIAARQLVILEQNAHRVRRGGILIYATCSLLPDENRDVVLKFLSSHPDFHGDDLGETLREAGVDTSPDTAYPFMLSLSPSEHGTDGFFVARMRRN